MPQRQKILGVDIDDAVRDALDKAAYKAGNASVLARMIGVSVGVMSQWKSDGCKRPIKVIPYKRWAIVYPHIREYLPPGDARYLPRDTQPPAVPPAFQPSMRETTTDQIYAALPPGVRAGNQSLRRALFADYVRHVLRRGWRVHPARTRLARAHVPGSDADLCQGRKYDGKAPDGGGTAVVLVA